MNHLHIYFFAKTWLQSSLSATITKSAPTFDAAQLCRFLLYHHVWSSLPRESFERQVEGVVQSILRWGWFKVRVHFQICASHANEILTRGSEVKAVLVCLHFGSIKFFCSYYMGHQSVLQGAQNVVIEGSNFHIAQNVCSAVMVVIFEILIRSLIKMEFHQHTQTRDDRAVEPSLWQRS